MQLYLMLNIFVSDFEMDKGAIPVDICFWKFLFQIVLNDSARRIKYAKHVLFSHSTVEKEFLYMSSKSVANKECWSRVVVIGY